jgi:nitrogen fixation protein NifT
MANVMIRRGAGGELVLYLPKKDLEDRIVGLEFDRPDKWGGELTLGGAQKYYVDPLSGPPKLPITLRARRVGESE